MGVTILISSPKKGRFQFQMIIFREGTGTSFKKNTLLAQ